MAIPTVSAFASYDQTANVNKLDISSFLSEALLYDFHLLGHIGMDPNSDPITDTIYYWLEDALNSDTLTLSISLGTTDTSMTYTASTAPHVGDFVTVTGVTNNNKEVAQITAVNSSTNSTISRGFAATTAASIATAGTVVLQRAAQEMSDIDTDASVNPTVRTSYTQIIPGRDLQVSGSQLARNMAASAMQDQVAHQLENRLKEWKRSFTRSLIYSRTSGPRSDTALSYFGGLADWVTNGSGQTYTTAGALALTQLNSVNTTIVDLGTEGPDTLLIGTGLVGSVNAIDATNRQLLESDKQVGYMVTRVLLGQGNAVDVVVDNRVNTGHAFLFRKGQVTPRPLNGRALFTLAGSDWVDGVKRRILGEWGVEIRQPQTIGWFTNQA